MLCEWIDAWVVTEEYGRLIVGLIIATVVFGAAAVWADGNAAQDANWPMIPVILAFISFVGVALSTMGLIVLRVLAWVVTGV